MIIIPLIPGFEGEIKDSIIIQTILKHTYSTICRGKGFSLMERLFSLMDSKYEDYISFFSLRNHSINPFTDLPETELVYVHSKIMIVDDKTAIIGSANINDRSMLGSRDSELALIIKEKCDYEITVRNEVRHVSKFCFSLRVRLLQEHLGFPYEKKLEKIPEILLDAGSDELLEFMKLTAEKNTKLYTIIFDKLTPCDYQKRFSDIKSNFKSFKNSIKNDSEVVLEKEKYKEKEKQGSFSSSSSNTSEEETCSCEYCVEKDEFKKIIISENSSSINNIHSENRNIFDKLYEKEVKSAKELLKKKYFELHKDIVGQIVEFPLQFLSNEKLDRPTICKERLVPLKNFL